MGNYPEKVFINGEILNHEDAKISVFDRGFLFGDGIYEVMVQINNKFFFGSEHLKRLDNCLKKIGITFDMDSILEKIDSLLIASNLKTKDCLLYMQVTRGIAPRKHAFPTNVTPTLMMYALPFTLPGINPVHISVQTLPDFRWHRCDIKTTSLIGNVMANDSAIIQNHYESVFIRNEKITEASHCNIFFVKNGIVYTHPADENILNGITRIIVLNLCKDLGIPYKEEGIKPAEIHLMDEAFLTGTSTQIASIKSIDDHQYYKGESTGRITKSLQEAFFKLK